MQLAPSPSKVVRKNAGLTEADIMETLDDMFDKTPPGGERPAKTFETEAPTKTKPRRATIQLSSPIVAVSKGLLKEDREKKVSAKAPPVKPSLAKTPRSSKTPAKSPKKTVGKTPGKSAKKAVGPKKTPAKSPKEVSFEAMLSDMKAVQARLDKLDPKIDEDPNTIFFQLEAEPASPDRIDNVVQKILQVRQASVKATAKTSSTRTTLKRRMTDASGQESTQSKRARLESPKPTTPSLPVSTKKTPRTQPRKILIARKKTPARTSRQNVAAAKSLATPAQVNPANLLRKNMRGKVEKAIVNKIAQKPDSSPYLLKEQVFLWKKNEL